MSDYDMSIHTNPDARAWAKFFMETWEKIGKPLPDEEIMIGWFANAMMAMHDHLKPTEAADLITALRAENEKLREAGVTMSRAADRFFDSAREQQARAEVAEAENQRLREFVLFVDKWTNYKPNKSEKPTSYEDCIKTIAPMAAEFARDILEKK